MEDFSLTKAAPANELPDELLQTIHKLSDEQKSALRHELDMMMGIGIGEIRVGDELGLQYLQGKALLESIMSDRSVAPNQKAQVFNTLQAQLEKMIKLRQMVFSQERLQRYEKAVLRCLEALGTDAARETFLDLYGSYLEDKGE
jgi:hypothetical protein